MNKTLIVVDMQNDFINGSLGSPAAKAIVPAVTRVIKGFDGRLFYTLDQHGDDYLDTLEGKKLPIPHCIITEEGYDLNNDVWEAIREHGGGGRVTKTTFGSMELPQRILDADEIYICGLCTDICVVSNALILRAAFPNTPIYVIEDACAGTSAEAHQAALRTMQSCQIDVIRSDVL